jgi:hypothetical protein
VLTLTLDYLGQFRKLCEGKYTPFIVLCGSRIKPHGPSIHIDARPLDWQYFTFNSPPREIREGNNRLDFDGEAIPHGLKSGRSKNPARVFLTSMEGI